MAQPTYGTAFLAIRPDLRGFGTSLTQGITRGGLITGLGKSAGVSFGTAFIGGIAALGIGKAIAGQISSAIDESLKFESAFAGVRKTVDGTVQQLDALRTGIIEMANVLPASREEIAGVAEAAGQLGIQTENILDFTKVMIDLGETTNLTADQAATAFAQIANVMKTPQTAFENMASTLVDLGNKGASTESQIIEFALRIAGAGEIAGLAESDVLAIGSAMASVGVEAEAGGTAIQKVLIDITKAVATGNSDLQIFAETAGLSAAAFQKAWEEDAGNAFALFVEGLGRAGDDAFTILDDLDLKDQRLIRSFLSLSGAGDLLRTSLETGNQAWLDNSAATEEANKRYETAAARLEIVKNRATELQREFGDQLVPIIVDLAEQAIPQLENAFKDLTTAIPGKADALDFVNFLSDLPRGFGQVIDLVKTGTENFLGFGDAIAGLFSFGKFGDVERGLGRVSAAFAELGQNTVARTALQSMVDDLRSGEEPALAFANAMALIGRRGKIDPKIVRTLSQIADVDPSQLVLELQRLIDQGPQLGLTADDIDALRIALLDLGPPSIEAIRQQNLISRGMVEVGQSATSTRTRLEPTRNVYLEMADAAEEAGLEFAEFVLSSSDVADELLRALDPGARLQVVLGAIGSDADLAAEHFRANLTPSIISVTDALEDLNKNGSVSLDEFITNLIEGGTAALNFSENLATIALTAPGLADFLSTLPVDVGTRLAQQIIDEGRIVETELARTLPEDLAETIDRQITKAIGLLQTDPERVDDLVAFLRTDLEKSVPGVTLAVTSALAQAFPSAVELLSPPDFNPLFEESIEGIEEFRTTRGLQAHLNVSFADLEAADLNPMMQASIAKLRILELKRSFTGVLNTALSGLGLTIDLFGVGQDSRQSFIDGLSTPTSGETREVRDSITSTMDSAIFADSPPKLFLDYGKASGKAFWSAFGEVDDISSFGVDGQKLLGKIRQSTGSVSFGGDSGGPLVDTLNVYNPIGEPTEESVQTALLEVAISPVVNRLVTAGSST